MTLGVKVKIVSLCDIDNYLDSFCVETHTDEIRVALNCIEMKNSWNNCKDM